LKQAKGVGGADTAGAPPLVSAAWLAWPRWGNCSTATAVAEAGHHSVHGSKRRPDILESNCWACGCKQR